MTTAFDAKDPARFDVPVPPQHFGQDGGKFYHYYDALADEIDDNMVTGLKEHLDGLLIFAGLFAGVNTAFLALTLPRMSPDPADDTNALLRDILFNLASGRNDSLPSTNALPSQTFSPNGKILTVNVLFSVSLTFALVSSFLAVLGRQWLVYYRKRSGGGPESQRWEQLKRFLGAERWLLQPVLDDVLPSLLQIGLILFCISLTIYLHTLHPTLSNVVGGFMCAGLATLIITAVLATWDKFCPFQSPLSHFIRTAGLSIIPLLCTILWPLVWIAVALRHRFDGGRRNAIWSPDDRVDEVRYLLGEYLIDPITSLSNYIKRKDDDDEMLQITAIRRAICTSDDAWTQIHAVSNILGITDADLLARLATDNEFDARISELCVNSYNRTLQLCGRDRTDLATATSWVYRAAMTHILLSSTSLVQSIAECRMWLVLWTAPNKPPLFPPSDLTQNASPNMTTACLAFVIEFAESLNIQTSAHRLALLPTIDGLVTPGWKCISIITEVMMVQWGIHAGYDENVHTAWIGKPSTACQNLKLLLEKSNDPQCQDRHLLREYVVDIFKLAGNAALDSGGDWSCRLTVIAGFLHFSEGLIRSKDSPSDLISAGRNLRPELISHLQSEFAKSSEQYWIHVSREALDELIQLFTELTPAPDPDSDEVETVEVLRRRCPAEVTVGGRSMSTLNWDDEELVHLFGPFSQQLVRVNPEQYYFRHRQLAEELKAIVANFMAVVKRVSREIKRLNRDPDLRWCHYSE